MTGSPIPRDDDLPTQAPSQAAARAAARVDQARAGDPLERIAPQAGRPSPPDPPMLPLAIGGTAVWAVLGLALLPFQHRLEAAGHGSWLWICVAGFLMGFPGIAVMVRHDAGRRRRSGQRLP